MIGVLGEADVFTQTRTEERQEARRTDIHRKMKAEDRVTCPQFKDPHRLLAKGPYLHRHGDILCTPRAMVPY